ncbi:MAG: ROK family protein [Clostridia bacterium]|nr:ROK family protein [Clostridia bacterium]
MDWTIGVDIGGMSIKAGLVDDNGKIIKECREKTAPNADACIKNLLNQINFLLDSNQLTIKEISGIGVGCPGAVSPDTGIVDFLPNLGWVNVPLVKKIQEVFEVPVKIANDASVAALAEATYGVAKEYNNCLMFTLGTGVGGGMVLDKKLYDGGYGRGGELGHIVLDINGEPCTCGRRGCVETFVSATALIKQTKRAMLSDKDSAMWRYCEGNIEKVSGKTAFECAKNGDKTAQKVVDDYVMYLSESIMSFLNVFRPDAFILGGGISLQGKYLTDKVTEYCERFDYGYKSAPKTKILCASLGNDAGIIGASALIK